MPWTHTRATGKHRKHFLATIGAEAVPEITNHEDHESEQRKREKWLQQQEYPPCDTRADEHADDATERAGDEFFGGCLAEAVFSAADRRDGGATEHAAEDVPQARADDDADHDTVERTQCEGAGTEALRDLVAC